MLAMSLSSFFLFVRSQLLAPMTTCCFPSRVNGNGYSVRCIKEKE